MSNFVIKQLSYDLTPVAGLALVGHLLKRSGSAMNVRTEFQVIVGKDGKPAFVVVPYDQFRRMRGGFTHGTVPNEVVNLSFERGISPMAAWREHFALTQAEVAARIGITQAAYAQMERVKQPRKATLEKVASAMGLQAEQLRW
jgi:prevent-host-death family protein